jgi:hypothetical protein
MHSYTHAVMHSYTTHYALRTTHYTRQPLRDLRAELDSIHTSHRTAMGSSASFPLEAVMLVHYASNARRYCEIGFNRYSVQPLYDTPTVYCTLTLLLLYCYQRPPSTIHSYTHTLIHYWLQQRPQQRTYPSIVSASASSGLRHRQSQLVRSSGTTAAGVYPTPTNPLSLSTLSTSPHSSPLLPTSTQHPNTSPLTIYTPCMILVLCSYCTPTVLLLYSYCAHTVQVYSDRTPTCTVYSHSTPTVLLLQVYGDRMQIVWGDSVETVRGERRTVQVQ